MTWQKVVSAADSKEGSFKVTRGESTPEEMDVEKVRNEAATINVEGLYLELESKSGNVYDFAVFSDASVDTQEMAADIIDALAADEDVWAAVDFDANGGDGRVLYWATGEPWDGGEVHDDYGISEGY